jgi:hypothetical protein
MACHPSHRLHPSTSQPQSDRRLSRPQLRQRPFVSSLCGSRLLNRPVGSPKATNVRQRYYTPSPHFLPLCLADLCLTTDCTIPERDPCVSKQQLHFEPGRPLFLPPMTAMLSRLGSPKPGRRSGVGYVTALDPLQSPLPINTYLSAVVLLHRVSVSPYPTLSQSPHLTRRIV